MCLIFPHYEYGTLHEFIIDQRMDDDYLQSAHLFSFAQDVAQAMTFLHSQQVIQRFVIVCCFYMTIKICTNVGTLYMYIKIGCLTGDVLLKPCIWHSDFCFFSSSSLPCYTRTSPCTRFMFYKQTAAWGVRWPAFSPNTTPTSANKPSGKRNVYVTWSVCFDVWWCC